MIVYDETELGLQLRWDSCVMGVRAIFMVERGVGDQMYFSTVGMKLVLVRELEGPKRSKSSLKLRTWSCMLPETSSCSLYPYSSLWGA